MAIDPELRQRLLELIYGLLPEDEVAALGSQIAEQEELAQAYAEAQQAAGLLRAAARREAPPIQLSRPTQPVAVPRVSLRPAESARPRPPGRAGGPVQAAWARRANWVVGVAAGILLLISVGGYFYHSEQLADIAAEHLRLRVTGPSRLQGGVPHRYTVNTATVTGSPLEAQIEFALYAPDGKPVMPPHKEKADEQGSLAVTIPAGLELPSDLRMEVAARYEGLEERVESRLEAEPERYITRLAMDKPRYRPGETVRYRSLTLSRLGLSADREVPVRFEVLDPRGKVVPGSVAEGKTVQGVGGGEFSLPLALGEGRYALVAHSGDGSFAEASRPFAEASRPFAVVRRDPPRLNKELEFVRQRYAPGEKVVANFSCLRGYESPSAGARLTINATVEGKTIHRGAAVLPPGGALRLPFVLPDRIDRAEAQLAVAVDDRGIREAVVKDIPLRLGKVRVSFYPEGGNLVAGLESRVYWTCRDAQGKPARATGKIVDSQGHPVAPVESTHEGMGSFSLVPLSGEQYRLKIDTPAEATEEPKLPEAVSGAGFVLNAGLGVFDAGKPLEFNVLASEGNRPLVAAAFCRGALVGQEALVTREKSNPVAIPLDEGIGGVIRLTIYDYRSSPPKPVAERLVYRRPAHRLQVQIAEHRPSYAPAEKVGLGLVLTDENGAPARGVLGAAVVDSGLYGRFREPAPLASQFLLTHELDRPEDLEHADFYLSEDPKAAAALDLLLGTQGWRRFVEKSWEQLAREGEPADRLARLVALHGPSQPPAMFDNLPELQARYAASVASYRANRTRVLNTLTTLSFFGGAGLVVFVAMLSLMNVPCGLRLWGPSVGVAAVCLVIGLILMEPGRLKSGSRGAVAFASFQPPAADAGGRQLEKKMKGAEKAMKAPADDAFAFPQWDTEPAPAVEETLSRHSVAQQLAEPAQPPPASPAARPEDLADRGERKKMKGGVAGEEAAVQAQQPAPADQVQQAAPAPTVQQPASADARSRQAQPARSQAIMPDQVAPSGTPTRLLKAKGGPVVDQPALQQVEELPQLDVLVTKSSDEKGQLGRHLSNGPFLFREYEYNYQVAQSRRRSGPSADESAETLAWQPLLATDAEGRASLQFALPDRAATYRVLVDAHAQGGRLGFGRGEVVARPPWRVEPRLPLQLTDGDRIDVPLVLADKGGDQRSAPGLAGIPAAPMKPTDWGHFQNGLATGMRMKAGEGGPSQQGLFGAMAGFGGMKAGKAGLSELAFPAGEERLSMAYSAGRGLGVPGRPFQLIPPGYPRESSRSGQIDGREEVTLSLPTDSVPGSLSVTLTVFPSPLAGIDRAAESAAQEAGGCFEQPAAASFLSALALQYLLEHDVASPAIARRAHERLQAAQAELIGYETSPTGFASFPGAPADEAATAWGLMVFREMAKVRDVDYPVIARATQWLKDRLGRLGDRRPGPDPAASAVAEAQLVWALLPSGQAGLEAQVERLAGLALQSPDPRLMALAAMGAIDAGRKSDGRKLLDRLAKAQADDGRVEPAGGSPAEGRGRSPQVETTALAALAWLKLPEYAPQADRAVAWVLKNRQASGTFGSPRATALASMALVEQDRREPRAAGGGRLIVRRADQVLAERSFAPGRQEAILVTGLEAKLRPGENRLTLELTGDQRMPYLVSVRDRSPKPVNDDASPLRLSTRLAQAKVKENQRVALAAELSNTDDRAVPITVATLGLPAGLEARLEQLRELKKAGAIDSYATQPRQVTFYWRGLAPKQKVQWNLDLDAGVPGKFTGPPSSAYLYSVPEQKQWAEPTEVEITR